MKNEVVSFEVLVITWGEGHRSAQFMCDTKSRYSLLLKLQGKYHDLHCTDWSSLKQLPIDKTAARVGLMLGDQMDLTGGGQQSQ